MGQSFWRNHFRGSVCKAQGQPGGCHKVGEHNIADTFVLWETHSYVALASQGQLSDINVDRFWSCRTMSAYEKENLLYQDF